MPSMSADLSPASAIALRTAQVASARVVLPEPRMYSVPPPPAIAYLSRRYFGLVASTSLGSGMCSPVSNAWPSLPVAVSRVEHDYRISGPRHRRGWKEAVVTKSRKETFG